MPILWWVGVRKKNNWVGHTFRITDVKVSTGLETTPYGKIRFRAQRRLTHLPGRDVLLYGFVCLVQLLGAWKYGGVSSSALEFATPVSIFT